MLTQGFRYEIAKRVLEQLDGDISDDRKLAAAGLKYIPSKRGGALALLERRDVAIPASDLQGRINEHMAALGIERTARDRALHEALDPRPQWEKDEDVWLGRRSDPETGYDGESER